MNFPCGPKPVKHENLSQWELIVNEGTSSENLIHDCIIPFTKGQDDIRNVNRLAFSQIPSKRLKQTQEHSYN